MEPRLLLFLLGRHSDPMAFGIAADALEDAGHPAAVWWRANRRGRYSGAYGVGYLDRHRRVPYISIGLAGGTCVTLYSALAVGYAIPSRIGVPDDDFPGAEDLLADLARPEVAHATHP